MRRSFYTVLPFFLLMFDTNLAIQQNTETQPLSDNSVVQINLNNGNESFQQQVSISPTSKITFNITDVPSNVAFIVFQVHTYQYNVTLSYDKLSLDKVSNRSVFGSNIGLYVKTTTVKSTDLFLKNDNVHVIDALIVAVPYTISAPIPGGCNMEFDTEVAAYTKLLVRDGLIIVDTQPASIPFSGKTQPSCEKNTVEHSMYRMYLTEQDFSPESYFTAIKSMLTVDDVIQNGEQIPAPHYTSKMRRMFSAYTGVGSVYVTVATYKNHSSVYVPAFSYACNPVLYPESCQTLNGSLAKMYCAFAFFLGFFSVFLGHYHLRLNMMLPIFFTGIVIVYGLVVGLTDREPQSSFGVAIGGSILITLVWLGFSACLPILATMIFNLTLGVFVTAIVYFCLPANSLTAGGIVENDWYFWTLFSVIALTSSIILTILSCLTSVMACAVIGSYIMILPFDYYAGSCLKYIVINLIRRAVVPGFGAAVVVPPHQTIDTCLTVFWACFAAYRTTKQWCRVPVSTIINARFIPRVYVASSRTPLIQTRNRPYLRIHDNY